MTQTLSPHRATVVRLVGMGRPAARVAAELGISRERVRQLWLAETGLPIPRLPARQPVEPGSRQARRFWSRVRVDPSGCWIWTGARYPNGYGSSRENGKSGGYAHRVAYTAVKGPIPTGLTIDHICRVKACVNPDHLEAVTQRENTLRSPIAPAAINARKTHCIHGHEFTPENTLRRGRERQCRTCHRTREFERARRRRVAREVA